jgi:hypothetical protein
MSLTCPLHTLAECGICAIRALALYSDGGAVVVQLAAADAQPNSVQFSGGRMRTISRLFGGFVLVISTAGCGGGGNGITPPPPPPPPPPTCAAGTFCMTASAFSPTTLTVASGSVVTWRNDASLIHNVTFANPSAALAVSTGGPSGNIPDHSSGTNSRRFNVGTTFECTVHLGMSGTIVVN